MPSLRAVQICKATADRQTTTLSLSLPPPSLGEGGSLLRVVTLPAER